MEYLEYPINVSVETVYESPTNFPAVTICIKYFAALIFTFKKNISILSLILILKHIFQGNLNAFNGLKPNVYNYIRDYKSQSTAKFFEKISGIKTSIFSDTSRGEDFMQTIGFRLEDMLLSCYYDGYVCSFSNFTNFTTYDRGNCFTFNLVSTNIQTSKQLGSSYGLQLELFNGFDGK